MVNHMHFRRCSPDSAIPFAGGTNFRSVISLGRPWTSPLKFRLTERTRRLNERVRRLSELQRSRPCSVAVRASSSSRSGLAEDVERVRKEIFEDGFAVFPQMWSKEEVGVGLVVDREQEKVLKSFLRDPIAVCSQRQWVHAPGHRCTDAASSPEPYWYDSWQIAGLKGEVLQRPPCSAILIVSLSDRNAKMFCGGVAVFPRSHWIVQDKIANSTLDQSSSSQPCDVPAAFPTELRLECGDVALLHPMLAYTIAPNISSSPAQFLVFNLGDTTSNQAYPRVDESEQMWGGWYSMENFLADRTASVEEEMMHLETEEGKAQLGGWQNTMTDLTLDQLNLATSLSTRAAPRDLLAWRLRNFAIQFMQDGEWSIALSMLLRRAGLRPNCYWTALQVPTPHTLTFVDCIFTSCRMGDLLAEAGRCCMKSAPAGQLGGRAGRKCTLEDGERFLLRAIEIAPGWPLAYAELMRCLTLMGRGREREISEVMEVMQQRCNFQQLCLRYPTVSDILQECWNDCESQCQTYF